MRRRGARIAYDDEEESKVAVRALGDQGLPGLRLVGSARDEIGNAVDVADKL